MRPIHELTEILARLPGLGPRQARRVVQFLLTRDQNFRSTLAELIRDVGTRVFQCSQCFRYDDRSTNNLCTTCADESRLQSQLMVVEHDVDIDAIEASLMYRGKYFVLGGHLSMGGTRAKRTEPRIAELNASLSTYNAAATEVIFALSTTPEGDYTAAEVGKKLRTAKPELKTSMLGRGLSVGAEIEYADPETVRNALINRN